MKGTSTAGIPIIPILATLVLLDITTDFGKSMAQAQVALVQSPEAGEVEPIVSDPDAVRTNQVFADGRARIFDGNIGNAREAALRAAYGKAVGWGAGFAVGNLTIMTNIRKVSDVVMARSPGFVRTYDVIREGVVEGGESYEILIAAKVVVHGTTDEEEIAALRLYLQMLGDPTLLLIMPGQNNPAATGGGPTGSRDEAGFVEADAPVGGAEAAIAQAFLRFGYQVHTSDDVASWGLVPDDVLQRARQGVTEDALVVARAASADLILLGVLRASSRAKSPGGVDISVIGEASAEAIIVSSGYLEEAFHTTVARTHAKQPGAISAVLDSLAEEFASALAWKIPSILVNHPRQSRLLLGGVSVEQAELVKTSLARLPEVEAARIVQRPTPGNRSTAELVILTGFVRVDQVLLFDVCSQAIGKLPVAIRSEGPCAGFALVNHDKYQISLERCDVKYF